MAFIKITSPHAHRPGNTGTVMSTVILACVPGLIALTVFFGFGSLVNVLLASIFCVGFEAAVLKLRQRKLQFYLRDYSALLTGILLGISLPPFAPWWLVLVACFFAIVVAKQLYGGLGFNPFNPAMIGYVVVLISFPLEMTTWLPPNTVALDGHGISFLQGLQQAFTGSAL
ncbi:MAG: electron transport complex protein RnfD, partial [Lentisphaeria bacterium]